MFILGKSTFIICLLLRFSQSIEANEVLKNSKSLQTYVQYKMLLDFIQLLTYGITKMIFF